MPAEVYIVSKARTPIGSFSGSLENVAAPKLGSICIQAVIERAGIANDSIDEVIMGNVVAAGIGQNPARQATLYAGLPNSVGATTINKVCGSGLKAVMLAAQAIRLSDAHVVVAGGMENMSQAPYLLPKARKGYRMGNGELIDSMIHDGLWDVYDNKHMGVYGDACATKFNFTREEQDDFAVRSYERARKAAADGDFDNEIVPVEIASRRGATTVSKDEEPTRFSEEKLRALRPAFGKEGTVTAGNASSINDGAAALAIASGSYCKANNLAPLAKIVASTTHSHKPAWFSTAPIGSIQKLLDNTGWSCSEVDLFEINEAFSNVTMAAMKELSIPAEKVNILGGAVALGHPIGASGARILVTLLTALEKTGGTRGIASLCIGGGEAVALAVEMVS